WPRPQISSGPMAGARARDTSPAKPISELSRHGMLLQSISAPLRSLADKLTEERARPRGPEGLHQKSSWLHSHIAVRLQLAAQPLPGARRANGSIRLHCAAVHPSSSELFAKSNTTWQINRTTSKLGSSGLSFLPCSSRRTSAARL